MEVVLSDSYKRQDKTQGYTVLLQAGRQRLNGAQAEQLVRHLPDPKAFSQRRQRQNCLLYTSPSPRDRTRSRMPSSA